MPRWEDMELTMLILTYVLEICLIQIQILSHSNNWLWNRFNHLPQYLKSKSGSDVLDTFNDYSAVFQNQFGYQIRTDNGKEYIKKYMKQMNILVASSYAGALFFIFICTRLPEVEWRWLSYNIFKLFISEAFISFCFFILCQWINLCRCGVWWDFDGRWDACMCIWCSRITRRIQQASRRG